jgi:hypothetical protein
MGENNLEQVQNYLGFSLRLMDQRGNRNRPGVGSTNSET